MSEPWYEEGVTIEALAAAIDDITEGQAVRPTTGRLRTITYQADEVAWVVLSFDTEDGPPLPLVLRAEHLPALMAKLGHLMLVLRDHGVV